MPEVANTSPKNATCGKSDKSGMGHLPMDADQILCLRSNPDIAYTLPKFW